MKKIYVFFALFVLMLSLTYAQDGNETELNNDNGNSTDDSNNNEIECTVNEDCESDETCVLGNCEDIIDETEELNDDSNNNTTNNSTNDLEDDELECSTNTDCESDEICISGECEDAEDETADYSENQNKSINEGNRTKWIKDCVEESSLKEVNELMLKIKRAENAREMGKVAELKEKLKQVNNEIKNKVEECNRLRNMNQGYFISEAVKYKNGSAAEIVEYYKVKLTEISTETDETKRLELLRSLRSEIDKEIKTIMEKKEIRNIDMKELVQKIEVRKDKIRADDIEVEAEDKTIITEINGQKVEIKVLNQQVKIIVGGIEVDTSTITIENNTLYYNGTAIKQLPSEALVRYKFKASEMELEQEGSKVIYKIKYEEHKKILGLFKAKATREAHIDSEDGTELEDKGPWWNFLATDDKSALENDSTNTE